MQHSTSSSARGPVRPYPLYIMGVFPDPSGIKNGVAGKNHPIHII